MAKATYDKGCRACPSDQSLSKDLKNVKQAEFYFNSIDSNIHSGNFPSALDYIGKVQYYLPEYDRVKFKKIETLARMGKASEAIKLSTQLLSSFRSDPELLYVRGLAYFYNSQTYNSTL